MIFLESRTNDNSYANQTWSYMSTSICCWFSWLYFYLWNRKLRTSTRIWSTSLYVVISISKIRISIRIFQVLEPGVLMSIASQDLSILIKVR